MIALLSHLRHFNHFGTTQNSDAEEITCKNAFDKETPQNGYKTPY